MYKEQNCTLDQKSCGNLGSGVSSGIYRRQTCPAPLPFFGPSLANPKTVFSKPKPSLEETNPGARLTFYRGGQYAIRHKWCKGRCGCPNCSCGAPIGAKFGVAARGTHPCGQMSAFKTTVAIVETHFYMCFADGFAQPDPI